MVVAPFLLEPDHPLYLKEYMEEAQGSVHLEVVGDFF